MDNPLFGVVAMLQADPVVRHVVGEGTVYGQTMAAITVEIDSEWGRLMPRRLVLVIEAGSQGQTDLGPLSWPRFDIRCYGESAWDASELGRLVFKRLFARHNMVNGLMAITLSAGPTPGRDDDTKWPYSLRTYDVLHG